MSAKYPVTDERRARLREALQLAVLPHKAAQEAAEQAKRDAKAAWRAAELAEEAYERARGEARRAWETYDVAVYAACAYDPERRDAWLQEWSDRFSEKVAVEDKEILEALARESQAPQQITGRA